MKVRMRGSCEKSQFRFIDLPYFQILFQVKNKNKSTENFVRIFFTSVKGEVNINNCIAVRHPVFIIK